MRALVFRLSTSSQSRPSGHNNVTRTVPTDRPMPPPRLATSEARTASLLMFSWKPSIFCAGVRTTHHKPIGRFSSAQAVAATLTILAGIHGFPLATTSAVLRELLSRRRREWHQHRERPDLIEDVPSPPTSASGPVGANKAQEKRDVPEEPDSEPPKPEKERIESPLEAQEKKGQTGINQLTGDTIESTNLARHSLSGTEAPHRTTGGPPVVVSRRDFAYESSSSLDTLPSHSSPPQARPPSNPSLSVLSFVTAPASPPQPSNCSIHRGAYGLITRSESPGPILARQRSSFNMRGSCLRIAIAADPPHELGQSAGLIACEKHGQTLDIPEEVPDPAPTIINRPTRRILIIGSDYRSETRQTGTMFSIETLLGVDNDIALLREAFAERGYDAELHDKKDYRREDVLQRVAAFLSDARSGDVRAVAFTGHAYSASDGTIMLVPPYCPSIDTAIPCADWEDNMRKHSQPGSIVFSIMAHCFSGDFMRQEHDYQTWLTPEGTIEFSAQSADKATFITFASSTKTQKSFESTVERRLEAGAYDHFLYALAMTIKGAQVRTWESFFANFKNNFDRARLNASWAHHYNRDTDTTTREDARIELECQRAYAWRKENLQEPRFSASEVLDYSRVFLLTAPT